MAGSTDNEDIRRLARELDELRSETRHNTAALAGTVRKARLQLSVIEHHEAIRKLAPPVSLLDWHPRHGDQTDPKVQNSLLDRLRQGNPVADSLGNTDSFIGPANVLANPTMLGFSTTSFTILTAAIAQVAPNWQALGILNSGAVTDYGRIAEDFARTDSNGAMNSAQILLESARGPAASDSEVRLETIGSYTPANGSLVLPFMVAAVRLWFPAVSASVTAYSAILEIYDVDTSAVVATSATLDLLTVPQDQAVRIYCATAMTPTVIGGDRLKMRLRILQTKGADGGGIAGDVLVGEPLFHQALSPDPMSFAPQIGRFVPDEVAAYGITGLDTLARFAITAGFATPRMQWSNGTTGSGYDARLQRSAAGELTLDNPFSTLSSVRLIHNGALFVRGPAAMDLAVSYASAGVPSGVTRTDDAVLQSTTVINYSGAQVASVVTTRFGRTLTVTPTYTGSDITSVHRAVT